MPLASESPGIFRCETAVTGFFSGSLLVISLMASLFYPFSLTTAASSNHLHFLSYLLKCPVDNAGNGISELLNLEIFWGSMHSDGDSPLLWSAFGLVYLISFAFTFNSHATPLKSLRISKTFFSRQF